MKISYGITVHNEAEELIKLLDVLQKNIDEDDEAESKLLLSRFRCQICNTSMDAYLVDSDRKLHICGNNPDCEGFLVEKGQYVIKGYDGPVIACDKCGNDMQLKTGRFGKYFGCTGQKEDGTNCKNTRKLLTLFWLCCVQKEKHDILSCRRAQRARLLELCRAGPVTAP